MLSSVLINKFYMYIYRNPFLPFPCIGMEFIPYKVVQQFLQKPPLKTLFVGTYACVCTYVHTHGV